MTNQDLINIINNVTVMLTKDSELVITREFKGMKYGINYLKEIVNRKKAVDPIIITPNLLSTLKEHNECFFETDENSQEYRDLDIKDFTGKKRSDITKRLAFPLLQYINQKVKETEKNTELDEDIMEEKLELLNSAYVSIVDGIQQAVEAYKLK